LRIRLFFPFGVRTSVEILYSPFFFPSIWETFPQSNEFSRTSSRYFQSGFPGPQPRTRLSIDLFSGVFEASFVSGSKHPTRKFEVPSVLSRGLNRSPVFLHEVLPFPDPYSFGEVRVLIPQDKRSLSPPWEQFVVFGMSPSLSSSFSPPTYEITRFCFTLWEVDPFQPNTQPIPFPRSVVQALPKIVSGAFSQVVGSFPWETRFVFLVPFCIEYRPVAPALFLDLFRSQRVFVVPSGGLPSLNEKF